MGFETKKLFLDDAYQSEALAKVISVDGGGIILDQSVFYATSGGQSGDIGWITLISEQQIEIEATIYGQSKEEIILVPKTQSMMPQMGDTIATKINWPRRYNLMRMHTALHLLCSCVPFPVTGGQIGVNESRLDFDMPDNIDKEQLTEQLNKLVHEDHIVTSRWISNEEMENNPQLVRTMSVKPPRGSGQVRLISIGENDCVDLQPCGGTHVRSTVEIGALEVYKVEKKGKQNRRIRVRLSEKTV